VSSAKYVALFLAESREHLQQCNHHLLAWERDPAADQPIQGLFRSVHTLKGMAAALGFARLANLAHAFEHVLAAVRDDAIAPAGELIQTGFRVVDRLEQGVALAVEGRDDAIDDEALVAELAGFARPSTGTFPVPAIRPGAAPAPDAGNVVIRVRLAPGTSMPGARAALVLRRAAGLGPVTAVTPPVENWGSEAFTGEFACRLATRASDDEIRAGLVEAGDVGTVEIERGGRATTAAPASRQVRVEQARLDRLVQQSGELTVAGHRLATRVKTSDEADLRAMAERLERKLIEFQELVLQARMAAVEEVFDRFPRAVRDLARQLGKQVDLAIVGGDIELDRAILDELPDVLLHLVRNAVDHGIEAPAEREAAGKPAEGRLMLKAERERNTVVITVSDDGRGLAPERVRARAREMGWDDDVDVMRLIGRQGFSTKREVTDVSGRGVGIDAVLHRIRSLGGAAELTSTPGSGTTVRLRLPLTLAVVPALLVTVEDERYAVPLGFVAETARLPAAGGTAFEYRGQSMRILDLGTRKRGAGPAVILEVSGRRGALAVDTLLGQEDIVVRPVDAPRGLPRWVNGATILADGLPALILDPTALV
jgi:two-component system chemotaxis sensor kinase CheA